MQSLSTRGLTLRSIGKKKTSRAKDNPTGVLASPSPITSSKRNPPPKPEMPFHRDEEGIGKRSESTTVRQALPKPERPFCTDDGASLLAPRLSILGSTSVDPFEQYYQDKESYELMFFGGRSDPETSSESDDEDAEMAMEDAGYQKASGSQNIVPKNSNTIMWENVLKFAQADEEAIKRANPSIQPQKIPLRSAEAKSRQPDKILDLKTQGLARHLACVHQRHNPSKPMNKASDGTGALVSPASESYNLQLQGMINDVVSKRKGEISSLKDKSVSWQVQEISWGEFLALYQFPGYPRSEMDPEKWALWALDFLQPDSVEPSSFVQELISNIKYIVSHEAITCYKVRESGDGASANRQDSRLLIEFLEQMPGSPWAYKDPEEWEVEAVRLRDFAMALRDISFQRRHESTCTEQSTNQESSTTRHHNVYSLLLTLKQRLDTIARDIANKVKCGSDITRLENQRKHLETLVKNSPTELTSQIEPEEWERRAVETIVKAGEQRPCTPKMKPTASDEVVWILSECLSPPATYSFEEVHNQIEQLLQTTATAFSKEEQSGTVTSATQDLLSRIGSLCERSPYVTESTDREMWKREARQLIDDSNRYHVTQVSSDLKKSTTTVPPTRFRPSEHSEDENVETSPSSATLGRCSPSEELPSRSISQDPFEKPDNNTQHPVEQSPAHIKDEVDASRALGNLQTVESKSQSTQSSDLDLGLPQTGKEQGDCEDEVERPFDQEQPQGKPDAEDNLPSKSITREQILKDSIPTTSDVQSGKRLPKRKAELEDQREVDFGVEAPQAKQAMETNTIDVADIKINNEAFQNPEKFRQAERGTRPEAPLREAVAIPENQAATLTSPDLRIEVKDGAYSGLWKNEAHTHIQSNEPIKRHNEILNDSSQPRDASTDLVIIQSKEQICDHEGSDDLYLQADDVKNNIKHFDADKHPTTSQDHSEEMVHGLEAFTGPQSPSFTATSSEAQSPPTSSAFREIKDEKTLAEAMHRQDFPLGERGRCSSRSLDAEDGEGTSTKASPGEVSALSIKGGCGFEKVGRRTYAELAKGPAPPMFANGSRHGAERKKDTEIDPWAVPPEEPIWGVRKA